MYNGVFQPVTKRQFGVSTHLYHGQRLSRDHLLEIAAHGFETDRGVCDADAFRLHNPAAVADLQQWLAEAGSDASRRSRAGHDRRIRAADGLDHSSLASSDAGARAHAVAEAEHALHIARRIPVTVLVTHLGVPRTENWRRPADGRAAARRSIEELHGIAEPLGVQIAVEVIPNELSRAGSLVHFVEDDVEGLEGRPVGICLDFGHAHSTAIWSTRSKRCRSTSSRRTCTTTAGAPTIISCPSRGRSTGRLR